MIKLVIEIKCDTIGLDNTYNEIKSILRNEKDI